MSLAMRRDIDLLPLKFLVRLSDSVSATSSSRTPAYPPPRDPEPVHTAPSKGREGAAATSEVRTIEIVVGAAWKDHGAIERFMDRVAGSGSRLSPGLWQVSAHLKRLGSSVGLVRCCLCVASRILANSLQFDERLAGARAQLDCLFRALSRVADGLVLAGFVLSLPRSCLLAHACAWCQATRLASRRSSCMWWTSSRSRALWSLLGPRFCPFLGITPCRFAPILFLVRLPDLPLPPPSSRFSLVSQTPCSIGFLSAAVFCLLTAL